METQKCDIFSKSSKLTKLNFVRTSSFRMPKKKSPWLRQYQSYISNWYVNGKVFTSTTTWEPKKKWFFFSKKFEIEFDLYFDLSWRAEIIQVGLNMHLYVDIGDASSSLWGSTSSFILEKDVVWGEPTFVAGIPSTVFHHLLFANHRPQREFRKRLHFHVRVSSIVPSSYFMQELLFLIATYNFYL